MFEIFALNQTAFLHIHKKILRLCPHSGRLRIFFKYATIAACLLSFQQTA